MSIYSSPASSAPGLFSERKYRFAKNGLLQSALLLVPASSELKMQSRRQLALYGVVHVFNVLLNIGYTFAQLVVFSRVLPTNRYSDVVFLISISLLLQACDSSVGRSAHLHITNQRSQTGRSFEPEAALVVYAYMALHLFLAICLPFLFDQPDWRGLLENSAFLLFALTSNYWLLVLQPIANALSLATQFAKLVTINRVAQYISLAALFVHRDFLLFSLLSAGINILAFGIFFGRVSAKAYMPSISEALRRPSLLKLKCQVVEVGASLQGTVAELLVLGSSYLTIAVSFGVGPEIVIYDTLMKLTRLTMTGPRILYEIVLPLRIRLDLDGRLRESRRLYLAVLAVAIALGSLVAMVVLFLGPQIFDLLLGPNNVIPESARYLGAAMVFVGSMYQLSVLHIGFSSAASERRALVVFASVGAVVLFAATNVMKLEVLEFVAGYTTYFALMAGITAILSLRMERGRRG